MTTLKEIAAEMRKWCRDDGAAAEQVVTEWASQLEALAGAEPVAWMDDFGNAFPLAANKGAGSWRDAEKRTWKPLYAAPQRMTVSREALRDALDPADAHTENGRGIPAYTIGSVMAALSALGIELRDEG